MPVISGLTPVILVMNDEYFLPYALESIRGWFDNYVIYDVGSKDQTENIIDWFYEKEKKRARFYIRKLPFVSTDVQGVFRNSMIAETGTNWYFIVDGDEVYHPESMKIIAETFPKQQIAQLADFKKIYGVFRRIEFSTDLTQAYDWHRSHHRIYYRTAIWKGTHPGESAVIPQVEETEYWYNSVFCYHFHNAIRSPLEEDVPSRMSRKDKNTYKPGDLKPYNLLEAMPMLRKPIESFSVNPALKQLQSVYSV